MTTLASARAELVVAGLRLAELGLCRGSGGNISIRQGDQLIVSPTNSDVSALVPSEVSVVELDGALREGQPPSKELPFHRAFYLRASHTRAVVHVHSPAALAVSCLEPWQPWSAIPPITPYFVMRVGQTPLIPYADPGDPAQASWILEIPFPVRAVLLQNHGIVTSGADISEAIDAAAELELTCDTLLRLGTRVPSNLPADAAIRLAQRYGSPWTCGEASHGELPGPEGRL